MDSHLKKLFIYLAFFTLTACGVKLPPLPPLPVTPQQAERTHPIPTPQISPSSHATEAK